MLEVYVPARKLLQRSRIGVLLLLASLGWARSSLAQAEPEARARFDAGVTAFEEGRFRDAIELFKEADRVAPSPRLSFNIARVYERMGDNRAALAAYREYLRRLPGAENRGEVSRRVVELEEDLRALGVQQLYVSSKPAGATLWIDGVSRGVTPWTGELPPGQHALVVRANGYRDATLDVELPAARAIDVDVPLASAGADAEAPAQSAGGPAPADGSTELAAAGGSLAGVSSGAQVTSAAGVAGVAPAPALDIVNVPRWWTWTIWGGAAVALGTAGVLELARADAEDAARSTPYQVERKEQLDAMQGRQTAARVCLIAGALAAVAGGVSFYFDLEHARSEPALAFGCDGAGCAVQAGGRF